jgi:hypothetical protein
MKDLPYFKFYCGEWINGNIALEDYLTQGLFINICAWYWSRECNVTLTQINKKFPASNQEIEYLLDTGMLKKRGVNIYINFLDEQHKERKKIAKRNKANGLRGGRPKTQSVNSGLATSNPPINPKLTNIEEKRREESIKENIDKRKEDFKESVKDHHEKLGGEGYLPTNEVIKFFDYWSEHGENDKKMRYEKERSFGIGRRLGTWKSNYLKANPPKPRLVL